MDATNADAVVQRTERGNGIREHDHAVARAAGRVGQPDMNDRVPPVSLQIHHLVDDRRTEDDRRHVARGERTQAARTNLEWLV